jgi:ferredoxin--NADP+ reductase
MGLVWCHGTVRRKQVWTDGLFTLQVAVDEVAPYEPGQFLQVGLGLGTDDHVFRPYSAASPHGSLIEFYIVRVDEGKLTPRLWNLVEGQSIEVSQRAAGSFTLTHAPRHPDLWLVGTGTGLAPYIAMLRTDAPWRTFEQIVVVHGVRYCRDLSYAEELRGWEATHAGRFRYLPMTTRESCPQGMDGRITVRLADGMLEREMGRKISPDCSTVLLCGNPAMLDEVELLLEQRGLKKHRKKSPGNIVVERYW